MCVRLGHKLAIIFLCSFLKACRLLRRIHHNCRKYRMTPLIFDSESAKMTICAPSLAPKTSRNTRCTLTCHKFLTHCLLLSRLRAMRHKGLRLVGVKKAENQHNFRCKSIKSIAHILDWKDYFALTKMAFAYRWTQWKVWAFSFSISKMKEMLLRSSSIFHCEFTASHLHSRIRSNIFLSDFLLLLRDL